MTWSSSPNITIDAEGLATAKATGKGWVKKSVVWKGLTFTRQYDVNVTSATGIGSPKDGECRGDGRIYTVTGQYLGRKTSVLPKGVYIRDGKKFEVR